jgi:hypothetical protein
MTPTTLQQANNVGNRHCSALSQKVHYDTMYQHGVAACPLVELCYSRRTAQGKKILAPPADSPPLQRWARGPYPIDWYPRVQAPNYGEKQGVQQRTSV